MCFESGRIRAHPWDWHFVQKAKKGGGQCVCRILGQVTVTFDAIAGNNDKMSRVASGQKLSRAIAGVNEEEQTTQQFASQKTNNAGPPRRPIRPFPHQKKAGTKTRSEPFWGFLIPRTSLRPLAPGVAWLGGKLGCGKPVLTSSAPMKDEGATREMPHGGCEVVVPVFTQQEDLPGLVGPLCWQR